MQGEIQGLLSQLQINDQVSQKDADKQQEAVEQTESLHSPTKSSDTKDVPITNLMHENFSYDSSHNNRSRQKIDLKMVKDESSRLTDQFILINHDDSNAQSNFQSNQDVKQVQKYKTNSQSNSGAETLVKTVPVITLKLCDFAEDRRKKKEMDTFEMTYSKDQGTEEQPQNVVAHQDYNTAQNRTLQLEDVESLSTMLRRQNSLDMILRKETLHRKSSKDDVAADKSTVKNNQRPCARVIAKSRSKVQSFHQRSQLINALYFRKALNETKKSTLGQSMAIPIQQPILQPNLFQILSQLPCNEARYLAEDLRLGPDFQNNFIENMDNFLIQHQNALNVNCPTLVKQLEMFRQQQIIYQQKLHIREREAGIDQIATEIDNQIVPSWSKLKVDAPLCQIKRKQQQLPIDLDLSKVSHSAIRMENESEPAFSQIQNPLNGTINELRESKESQILQNILNDQKANRRDKNETKHKKSKTDHQNVLSNQPLFQGLKGERGSGSVEKHFDSMNLHCMNDQKLQFETPKFQQQRNFMSGSGLVQNYQSVGSLQHQSQIINQQNQTFPKNLHERQKSNGSMTFNKVNVHSNSVSFGGTFPDGKLTEMLNNPFQNQDAWK